MYHPLLYGRTARHSFEICSFQYSAWKLKNPFFLKSLSFSLAYYVVSGLFQTVQILSYPWVWNNWKIPSVSFWITAKSSAKHVIISCNQIQVPFRFISCSFISLSTVTFLTEILLLWRSRLCILNCIFQLDCVWDCLIFRNGSFCFVLFCFSVEMVFQIRDIEWALDLVFECSPWCFRLFPPWRFTASCRTRNELIASA